MSGVSKITAERSQRALLELVAQPGNDVCADCKGRSPRWASHNLGIFVCVRCASIHRKMGTHISKVKSLTLDSWTKEQVENMKIIGNVKANQYWNPDERRNPIPTNFEESERDSELEKYIRAKYEHKRFLDKRATVAAKLGPSRSKNSLPARSHTAPIDDLKRSSSTTPSPSRSPAPPVPSQPPPVPSKSTTLSVPPTIQRPASVGVSRPATQPTSASSISANVGFPQGTSSYAPAHTIYQSQPMTAPAQTTFNPFPRVPASAPQSIPQGQSWNDLASLQAPSINTITPLQYQSSLSHQQSTTPTTSFSQPQSFGTPTLGAGTNPYANLSVSPNTSFTSSFGNMSLSSPSTTSNPMGFGYGGQTTSTNPYQQQPQVQQQQTFVASNGLGATYSSSPTSSPFNPFSQQQQQQQQYTNSPIQSSPFGTSTSPFSQHTTSSSSLSPFQPHSASAYGSSPFGTGTSPSPLSSQSYSMPPASAPANVNGSSSSHFAQQAQQVFQSMTNSNNPFGGHGGHWGS